MSDPFSSAQSLEDALALQRYPITRTVAIIKPHALSHRFEIEHRIQEASFEIVKERRMEFDTETDPDTLFELFGEDAASFSEGPVWVYVLERRRAIEVWATLMGNTDPAAARAAAPHSLRALFGTDAAHNAVMGSPDTQTAEIQIASLFASSPPFPTADLPPHDASDVYDSFGSARPETPHRAGARDATASTLSGSRASVSSRPATFRARPVPATTGSPSIVPRTTRAAALRAGERVEKTQVGPRTPPSKEQLRRAFENVPGHKRAGTIAVASTAAPSIVPKMTRAAALRIGLEDGTPPRRRRESGGDGRDTFEGVPGHKRRESIAVASVRPPNVSPRSNKSAELRQRGEQGPPSSFMFRGATTPKRPGVARDTSTSSNGSSSKSVSSPAAPSARSPSQTSLSTPPSRHAVRRPSSVLGTAPAVADAAATPDAPATNADADADAAPKPTARPPRPSSVASVRSSPSITPRTNRSAVLRAAKQEAESSAAAAAAARKKNNRLSRAAPSSFKPIVV